MSNDRWVPSFKGGIYAKRTKKSCDEYFFKKPLEIAKIFSIIKNIDQNRKG